MACYAANGQSTQNALHFDGSNDYVQTTFTGVTGTANRTFEAWVYITSTPSGNSCILDYGTNSVGNRNTFFINSNRALGYISGGTNANITSSTNVVPLNTWTHVAFVLDNGTGYLYVDGVQRGTGNLSTVNTATPATNFRIGERIPGGSIPFDGIIDEVRVWNVAKTATQLVALKDDELCPSQAGLVAYYRCNEGLANGSNSTVTTLVDNSTSSNNGTLNNFGLSGSTSNWVAGASLTSAPDSDSTFAVEACGSYSSPGGQFITSSQTLTETITNSFGCDSAITIDVTIKQISFTRDTIEACDSFRSVQGTLYTSTNIFTETFTNDAGCDSIVQTFLTVGNSTRDTLDIATCYSYTSPNGTTWNTSGTYTESLISKEGCDSILVINLTISDSSTSVIYDTACVLYTSAASQTYYTSGTYREKLVNSAGCDSIVTLHLVINSTTDSTITTTACDSFSSESGANTWFSSGRYSELFSDRNTCDSTVLYVLTINQSSSSSISYNECAPITSPGGTLLTTSGIYTDVLTNTQGCDSTITLDVTITDNMPVASKNGDTLEVNLLGLSYQWVDCENMNRPIPLAMSHQFVPTKSGEYAVVVSQNNCKDTSNCVLYPRTARTNTIATLNYRLTPNPAQDYFQISTESRPYHYIVRSTSGEIAKMGEANSTERIRTTDLANGVYTVEVKTDQGIATLRLVIFH